MYRVASNALSFYNTGVTAQAPWCVCKKWNNLAITASVTPFTVKCVLKYCKGCSSFFLKVNKKSFYVICSNMTNNCYDLKIPLSK